MKQLFMFVLFILTITNAFCQSLKREGGETAEEFVMRTSTTKTQQLSGKVIETKWNSEKIILAFFEVKQIAKNSKERIVTNVDGYAFVPVAKNLYHKIFIDSYGEEGAVAEIEAIFFSNADKDIQEELIILCSWGQNHYGISGKIYQPYIYDHVNFSYSNEKLEPLNSFKKIFNGEFDGTNDSGKKSKAKYINAKNIKQKLKRLGY